MAKGFKAEMQAIEGDWGTNALVFPDHASAADYAVDLFGRWMGCKAWRVIEVDEEPNRPARTIEV